MTTKNYIVDWVLDKIQEIKDDRIRHLNEFQDNGPVFIEEVEDYETKEKIANEIKEEYKIKYLSILDKNIEKVKSLVNERNFEAARYKFEKEEFIAKRVWEKECTRTFLLTFFSDKEGFDVFMKLHDEDTKYLKNLSDEEYERCLYRETNSDSSFIR